MKNRITILLGIFLFISISISAQINRYNQYATTRYTPLSGQEITYSNQALSFGWYNSKLYYNRGIVYRDLDGKILAKTELKSLSHFKSNYKNFDKTTIN
jgi:hypothetical protein